MSSRFLSYGSGGADLTVLQDGTFAANLAEITAGNLTPNMPVLTDNRKKLISAKISNNELDTTLQQFVTDTNFKTIYINLPISPEGTVFSNAVIADEFKINNGPNPPLFLLSDGTRTSVNDNAFIILDSNPYNTFENISASLGDVFYNTTTSSIFGFQPPFRDEPAERIPTGTYSTFDVSTEAEFDAALTYEIPPTYILQLRLTANITFTSAKTITSAFKLISDTGSRVITFSSATNIINFMGYYNDIDGVEFRNNNTSSSATCLAFSTTSASNSYVKNCVFRTNEFAITSVNTQIQITDNYFLFDGTSDSHRYIALYKNTGSTIIARNVFQGNPLFSTAGILISVVAGSSFINGKFVFKNNTTYSGFPVQRLCISDASFNVNDNLQFWIHDNNIVTTSGFMIFYGVTPMTGVLRIVAYNNTEVLGGSATGSKGIIACDNISATNLPARTGTPYITTFNNTQPALRTDYTGWTSDNNTAYNNTVISAAGNTPKLYSAVLQDIIGSDITEKVANINLPLEPLGTRFLNDVYADRFVVYNGPSPAGFLMSDGTILTTSSSNINSNIYLYNNNLTTSAPPSNGQIRYNNSVNQNATEVYISHLTRDGIDIDPFLALITQLSILYIQDQDNSANYIKYNVSSNPVITPNSYVTVSVTFLEGNGTGLTNFPAGMNIFLSIFTNDLEINSRLSNLETATQNLTATSSDSTFSQTLKMGGNRIQTVAAPIDVGDAVNKSYVDGPITALNTKTQHQTANVARTTWTKNARFLLDTLEGFDIRNSIDNTNILLISQNSLECSKPLNMNTNNINGVNILTATSVSLGGAVTSVLRGNGSTLAGTVNQIVLGNGTLTTSNANSIMKGDATQLAGTVNQVVLGNGTLATSNANSIMKGNATTLAGTVNQVVLGNGTLTTSNANSIMKGDATTLAGTSLQYVMGNGSLLTATYTTMVSSTFTATFGTVSNATFKYTYVFNGTTKVVTLGIPHIRSTITGGPLALFSSTTTALPAIIRPATESVSSIRLVVAGVFDSGYIILASTGLISFSKISTAWANDSNGNGSGCSIAGDYMYITYVV